MIDKFPETEAEKVFYDRFVKNGLAVGFTDDQIDFLWDYLSHNIT